VYLYCVKPAHNLVQRKVWLRQCWTYAFVQTRNVSIVWVFINCSGETTCNTDFHKFYVTVSKVHGRCSYVPEGPLKSKLGIRVCTQNIPDWRCKNHKPHHQTRVKTAHVLSATCNLAHWLARHGSPTIYRCFKLPQLLYRWRHQSGIFWIHPRTYLPLCVKTQGVPACSALETERSQHGRAAARLSSNSFLIQPSRFCVIIPAMKNSAGISKLL
jgi:hypothetical protein